MFSDENFLAQATFLVKGLKTGKGGPWCCSAVHTVSQGDAEFHGRVLLGSRLAQSLLSP